MNRADADDDHDVGRLLGELEEPVRPSATFRRALTEELQRRIAPRRGEGELPEGWAVCPFERFSLGDPRLPRFLGANCPFLLATPLMRMLKRSGLPLHVRPCPGLQARLEGRDEHGPLT